MNIKVGTVYIDVEPDVSKFSEKLRRKLQETDLGKAVEQTINKTSDAVVKLGKDSDRTSVSLDRIGDKTTNFNNKMLLLRNVIGLIKIPALFAALNLAAQALVALTAGATAAVAALGPLAGLVIALPAGLLGVASAATTVKLAFAGVKEELKELGKTAEKTVNPAAKQFALFLYTLKPIKDELQAIASGTLLPGIEKGMLAAFSPRNILSAKSLIGETAAVLGDLATRLGMELRDPAWSQALLDISESTSRAFDAIGGSLIESFLPGVRDLLTAGRPLIQWLTDVVAKGLKLVGVWFSNASASGRAAKFFQETADITYLLGKILGRLGGSLAAIGKAAYPLGKLILVALNNELGKLLEWARSASGQASLTAYFESAIPTLKAFVLLAAALVKTIFSIGQAAQGSGLAGFFDQIRTEVLPILQGAVDGSAGLAQALLDMTVAAAKFVAIILSVSGPVTAFAGALAAVASALGDLLANNPLLAEMLTTFLGLAALTKIFQLKAAIGWIVAMIAGLKALQANAFVAATAMQRLNYAMRANIIGLVVTAVQLLVVGFILLYKRSETFRNAVHKLMFFLRDVGVVIIKVLTLQFRIMLRAMEAMFEVASHLPFVGDKFKGVAEKIHTVRGALDGAIGALENVGNASNKAADGVNNMATRSAGAIVNLEKVAQGKLKSTQASLAKMGQTLSESFSDLSSKALRAFDADTNYMLDNLTVKVQAYGESWTMKAGDLTPAERELAALDKAEAKRDRALRRSQLLSDLKDAKGRPDEEATFGGKTIVIKKGPDTEKIKSINEELRQLNVDDRRTALQARAVVEKAAADKALETGKLNLTAEREVQKEHFEKELTALQEAVSKGKLTQAKFRTETMALLAKYGVSLKGAGQRLGNAFAGSLNRSMAAVQEQARITNAALTKILTLRKEIDAYERARKVQAAKDAKAGLPTFAPFGGLQISGGGQLTGLQGPVGGMVVGQYVQNQTVNDESSARELAATAARKVARR